jgi:hypothetical protein
MTRVVSMQAVSDRRVRACAIAGRSAWGADDGVGRTGSHLTADGGSADAQWFHRASWHLVAGRRRLTVNIIAFDAHRAYTVAANKPSVTNFTYYIPAGGEHARMTSGQPGDGPNWLTEANLQTDGYLLFADALPQDNEPGKTKTQSHAWNQDHFPICPWAMIIADRSLFVAGFRDRIDPQDPWATFEGRRGGVLDASSQRRKETGGIHARKSASVGRPGGSKRAIVSRNSEWFGGLLGEAVTPTFRDAMKVRRANRAATATMPPHRVKAA